MKKKLQKSKNLKLIDSARFMTSSLSNLVNNLAEEIHKIKCKYGLDNKKGGIENKYKGCKCHLAYTNLIVYNNSI